MTGDGPFGTLEDVGSIPTASFHEGDVARYVANYLGDLSIPLDVDLSGNIIATYRNGVTERPIALVAHLDHPAVEVSEILSSTQARAILLGSVPSACFDRPVAVSMLTSSGRQVASIVGRDVNPDNGRVARLHLQHSGGLKAGDWGIFDLPAYSRNSDDIEMRAADDLAGVAAALEAIKRIAGEALTGVVYGVFTRAEEVGLIGAALVANERRLPLDTMVISIECSRALPGAEIGGGPIIRVGDRSGTFHPAGEAVLLAARDLLPDTQIQRQLMTGGTCEATAFVRAGYRATGIALPLGNYHNVGQGNTIVPELINGRDYLGAIELLVAAARVAPVGSVSPPYVHADTLAAHQSRLIATVAPFRSLISDKS